MGVELVLRKAFPRNLLEDTLKASLTDFFLVIDLDPDLVEVRQEFLVAPLVVERNEGAKEGKVRNSVWKIVCANPLPPQSLQA